MTVAQRTRAYLSATLPPLRDPRTVYFIGCRGLPYVKIGKAFSPGHRLKDLQVGCPVNLFIMATTTAFSEYRLHYIFKSLRVRGEWFKLDWELQNFINQLHGS